MKSLENNIQKNEKKEKLRRLMIPVFVLLIGFGLPITVGMLVADMSFWKAFKLSFPANMLPVGLSIYMFSEIIKDFLNKDS